MQLNLWLIIKRKLSSSLLFILYKNRTEKLTCFRMRSTYVTYIIYIYIYIYIYEWLWLTNISRVSCITLLCLWSLCQTELLSVLRSVRMCIYICIYISVYTHNHTAQAGWDIRPIFKWSLTGVNSEFSSSNTSCHNKV